MIISMPVILPTEVAQSVSSKVQLLAGVQCGSASCFVMGGGGIRSLSFAEEWFLSSSPILSFSCTIWCSDETSRWEVSSNLSAVCLGRLGGLPFLPRLGLVGESECLSIIYSQCNSPTQSKFGIDTLVRLLSNFNGCVSGLVRPIPWNSVRYKSIIQVHK